jgi:ABC transport system ATP-binding/permease protein
LWSSDQRAAGKELQRLERTLDKLTKREAKLHTDLAEASTNPDRLLELDAQLRDLLKEKDEVEERWLEIADSAE